MKKKPVANKKRRPTTVGSGRLVRPLACPFCGVKPTLSVTTYARVLKMKPLWYLRCENKACPVDVKVFNHDKKQLVADWNKQPNDPS
jgi:hypothetical protein